MAAISDLPAPWRKALRPASFRGVAFHVDVSGLTSGRRTALHEYPKRDLPYAEDMGRRARRWRITGYIVAGPQVADPRPARDRLIAALEAEGPALLVHPSLDQMAVLCEGYSVEESRERGGYYQFEMQFTEAGLPGFVQTIEATSDVIQQRASESDTSASAALDTGLTTAIA